ncbi:nhp2l1 [Symbiodinium natans]|uniref:Nhp2l1 protein n=1 Tax=Symbiodinium natans TaxID=878477 RepID=A0A812SU31_9DINO|nr:nhp2l1 [Symbiodinium natans]
MGVPDDANPMNRRLPAEVVTRKKQSSKKEEKEESSTLQVDPKQVHGMKPEQRMKWLAKALQKCQDGKAEKTAIYDIMTHAKFPQDCSSKLGAKMYRLVRAHAVLFSQKQKKFLEGGDYALHKLYKKAVKKGEVDEDEAGAPSERGEDGSRKVASRSRDDARGPDIGALWDSLTALSPAERAARVAALDDATKEKLEAFLEARISGAQDDGSGPEHRDDDERSAGAPAMEEESGHFSVTLRKLDLSLDTSDEDFLIIKEITPAVSKWNKTQPDHPIQVFDRLLEVNGSRAHDVLEKAMRSSSEATLRFQRPQQRTVVLKQPGTGTQGASGVSEPALSEGSFGVTSKEADARDICK